MKTGKDKRNWSYVVILRYGLFQLPGIFFIILILISLYIMFSIPLWIVWTLIVVWIVKYIIMFPLVWRAYDKRHTGVLGSLVGLRGRTLERLSPEGYVKVRGELWHAKLDDIRCPVDVGEPIDILGLQGSTLTVRRSAIGSE